MSGLPGGRPASTLLRASEPDAFRPMFRSSKKKLNLKRCLVPEGHFWMGTKGESFDAGPVHKVYVSAFEMAQYPVLNQDYGVYLKKSGEDPPEQWGDPKFDDPRQPVVGVNWHEARKYCQWLSEQTGSNIRLPTEAEFEKAARGGLQHMTYPWGHEREAGRYKVHEGPLEAPYAAGTNPPNAYGLYDMVSNVHQWCLDGYDPDFYSESPERNPQGAEGTPMKVARGWSWTREDLIGRVAARTSLAPYFRVNDFGIRWVIGYKVEW